ncbi:DUF2634 domain-containing protein [Miniphocaeibacter massiliensis]|uniref:DUF2634 domain-containing protein n=1 Tax=Miniphocaeibacter massiliensis TaxID=2041841 RepID=UPI000C089DDC|nr:DUF2634 domain-containing protein [Miniphocaeibacter massiliensis]
MIQKLLFIIIPLIISITLFLFKSYAKDLTNYIIKLIFKKYVWIPSEPLKNQVTYSINPIKDYPKDYKLSKNGIEGFVTGKDALDQALRKFIHTERNKYKIYDGNYGIEQSETIFQEKNITEFERQCEYIANDIISSDIFNNWIEIIYKISRNKNKLIIEMKLKGEPNTHRCIISENHI